MATPCRRGGFRSGCCFLIGCRTDEEDHVTNERKGDRRSRRTTQSQHPVLSSLLLNSLTQILLNLLINN